MGRHALAWITLAIASGLVLIALADRTARQDSALARPLFWAGLMLVVTPSALRICHGGVAHGEAAAIVTATGGALYLVKVFHSPLHFTFSDEFYHWRGVIDIIDTGRLFTPNVLQPVVASYPGLATAAAALVQITGVTPFAAGVLLIGSARLLMTWALYLLFWRVCGSARAAGLASLIYMANPNYVFFQAQFAYESLALPFAATALAFVVARDDRGDQWTRVARAVIWTTAVAIVMVTHHLTALALCLCLLALLAVDLVVPATGMRRTLAGALVIAVVGTAVWTGVVARRAIPYLAPVLTKAGTDFTAMAIDAAVPRTGLETTGLTASPEAVVSPTNVRAPRRQLFRNFAGDMAPLSDRVLGLTSVLFLLAVLPVGIRRTWIERRHVVAIGFACMAIVYPLTLTLRLTRSGAETSNRASEFVFIAMATALAIAAESYIGRRARARIRVIAFVAWLAVVFAGGLIIGWGPWARLPGAYLIAAESRSVDAHGIEAARWTASTLGPDRRVIADRTHLRLMGTYGHQHPVTITTDRLNVAEVLFANTFGRQERQILRRGRVQYVVVDRRIAGGLPIAGVYVEPSEPQAFVRTQPIGIDALEKFDRTPGVGRLFDDGTIRIYDVESLSPPSP